MTDSPKEQSAPSPAGSAGSEIGGASSDPLLWAMIVLYRRCWIPALGALVGAVLAFFALSPGAPRFVADAQLYIQERPVVADGLQEPINAVAYKSLLESPAMLAAAEGASSIRATVRTTQDTNFGKYYSPVIDLELTAATAEAASSAAASWRDSFLEKYGDLATRPANQRLERLERRSVELEEKLRKTLEAELAAEALLRPLLLRRADIERSIAPFTLELPEPVVPRPRAQVYTREQVVAQDITVAAAGAPAPRLRPIPGDVAVSEAEPAGGEEFEARLRSALVDHRLLRDRRLKLEAELYEVARHAETNRLIVAGATAAGAGGDAAAESTATAFEAADVIWLEGAETPRRVSQGRPASALVLAALAGFVLAAAWLILSEVSRATP